MRGQRRERRQPDQEFVLLAGIKSCSLSYFISGPGTDSKATSDEAIIELGAEITSIIPKKPEHIGKELNCSLISSHIYRPSESHGEFGAA